MMLCKIVLIIKIQLLLVLNSKVLILELSSLRIYVENPI